MGAATAGGTIATGRRLDHLLVRTSLLHLVEDAAIGRHYQLLLGQLFGRLDQLTGGAHRIGQLDDGSRRLRVHQHGRIRVLLLELAQGLGLEFVMDDAVALPAQHLGPRLLLDIGTEVPVRAPDDLVALAVEVFDYLKCNAGRHHPVRPCLHRRRGIGIDHHYVVGVGIAEGREFIDGTAQIERTLGLQGRHQYPLVRAQDLGGLPHEANPGDDQGLRGMIPTKAGHLERVTDETATGLGQCLDLGIRVVVGNQHGLTLFQQCLDVCDQGRFLLGGQRGRFDRERVVHLDHRRDIAQCIAHCDCSIKARKGKNYNQKPATNPSTNPVIRKCPNILK